MGYSAVRFSLTSSKFSSAAADLVELFEHIGPWAAVEYAALVFLGRAAFLRRVATDRALIFCGPRHESRWWWCEGQGRQPEGSLRRLLCGLDAVSTECLRLLWRGCCKAGLVRAVPGESC
jgi:hypothetical protein